MLVLLERLEWVAYGSYLEATWDRGGCVRNKVQTIILINEKNISSSSMS